MILFLRPADARVAVSNVSSGKLQRIRTELELSRRGISYSSKSIPVILTTSSCRCWLMLMLWNKSVVSQSMEALEHTV